MWRQKLFANTINTTIHLFIERSNQLYLYNVFKKELEVKIIDKKVPVRSKTIAIKKNVIFIIGGYLDGERKSINWEYNA